MKITGVISIIILLTSCRSNGGATTDASVRLQNPATVQITKPEGSVQSKESEYIPCISDADCPRLSCGPCNEGQIIRRRDVELNCHHNPCINARSQCGKQGLCVVHIEGTYSSR